MGRAFEATDGELAEKLFAALKAGDDAGGDSRGKQSASMIVVRKGGGRNINNDRYLYLNVDDNPHPIPELRRLLDMNLGYLWQARIGPLTSAGKTREAREASAKYAAYMPSANAWISVGVMDYNLADKPPRSPISAKALALDPTRASAVRSARSGRNACRGRGGQRMAAILATRNF